MSKPATILIAESDVNTAVPLLLHLQDHGFRALHAPDGTWALKLARAARTDLILLAVDLPRLGGLAVCRMLREESAVPILLLVAAEREQDGLRSGATHFRSASHLQVRGLEAAADACLVKPFSFRELLARVHALLRRRGGNRPLGFSKP